MKRGRKRKAEIIMQTSGFRVFGDLTPTRYFYAQERDAADDYLRHCIRVHEKALALGEITGTYRCFLEAVKMWKEN